MPDPAPRSSPDGPVDIDVVEGLFADYITDPASVPARWRACFDALPADPDAVQAALAQVASAGPDGGSAAGPAVAPSDQPRPEEDAISGAAGIQHCVNKLVRAYRVRGHMSARVDPLELAPLKSPELDPAYYGLQPRNLDRKISPKTLSGCSLDTPRAVIERLRETYTRSIGVQFMHIDDLGIREWLQQRMETVGNHVNLTLARQLRILTKLTDATIFEDFIQKKFVGAKSFSLEGSETLIPLLDLLIERASVQGVNDIVIGMAHRGRLNVLANVVGKNAQEIFREFADLDHLHYEGRGDVKYHLGYRGQWTSSQGETLRLSLCFNPSHLEFVDPVAVGRLRARQDRKDDTRRRHGLCILLHGDAAFAGEGVVQETLNMSQLSGYAVGGTIHVIINNQIGFTTTHWQARSAIYASGVAKMLQVPIFHVNGEDPEAAAQVVRLAVDFRHEYQRDVVIDMYGYRRRGHNETDEPRFTQPLQYQAIQQRKPVRDAYLQRLLSQGGVTGEQAELIASARRERLETELASARSEDYIHIGDQVTGDWSGYNRGLDAEVPDVDTGVPATRLRTILQKLGRTPQEIVPDRRIARLLQQRADVADGTRPVDWACAEALAFGSLLLEGFRVRLTGQDCERGTFSHRHAVVHDCETGFLHVPLQHLSPRQGAVEIHNSPLSETGPLGFEYGYSLESPDGLIIWEAQFGDFVNAAQVIVDQFISSGEDKWSLWSGLVLLLPHGFEGQGPEHSSARLERFLQLAAEDNIQVVNPTTPAQYFHLLRRQMVRPWRKPLIVMAPKSLLRHPQAVSGLDELSEGRFHRILGDPHVEAHAVTRVLACSGKLYYDLKAACDETERQDIAIIRFEQLYPLSRDTINDALAPFGDTEVWWTQEEPMNMGAWTYFQLQFPDVFSRVVCRPASASPATGSPSSHKREQRRLIEEALAVA